ncbi:MerC domain-containing protein [Aquimarina algicola]|uniref:MerC domain-containing protein n=2 Tax=Aquimarina algicola TaxID=2589995 RepID=A0A504J3M5_9FLAO|nr:MerC domain-containing protein [Aquimarina algicola]
MIASSLCLLHCLITPFLFMAHAGTTMFQDTHSIWWKSLDIVFLGLSFIAISRSVKTTAKPKMKYAFWTSWVLLFIIVMNEKLSVFSLPEQTIYPVSLLLVALHFYNLKYCQCKEECCEN